MMLERPPAPMIDDVVALRFCVTVYDYRSFSRAAHFYNVKQSTLSRRIALLEHRLKVRMFERSTRGAVPTMAGERLIPLARAVLADLDGIGNLARNMANGQSASLGLGFSGSLASGSLRTLIAKFRQHNPGTRVVEFEGDRSKLSHALRSRTIDLAIVAGDFDDSWLQRRPLWSERIMVAMPDDHPLTGSDRIYWTDLRREHFLISRCDPGEVLTEMLISRTAEPGRRPVVEQCHVGRENNIEMVTIERRLRR